MSGKLFPAYYVFLTEVYKRMRGGGWEDPSGSHLGHYRRKFDQHAQHDFVKISSVIYGFIRE